MKLVFSNCILYNGSQSEIGKIGIAIGIEFDRLCKEAAPELLAKDETKSEIKTEAPSNYDPNAYGATNEEYKFDDIKEETQDVKEEEAGDPNEYTNFNNNEDENNQGEMVIPTDNNNQMQGE
jgi:hypothetical protein